MEIKRMAVTGAFGYSGKYITRLLLGQGKEVITLTGNPDRPNEFGGKVKAVAFNFDKPDELTKSLVGVDTLFNTYWVRFSHGKTTYRGAVENTKTLIRAAKAAGVRRFVHVSICNPTEDSPLAYYKGKAELERFLKESGLPYAILRPTVIFGKEDILINNIAWMLRHFPVFAVPGDGRYRMQPIFVEDMAKLAVEVGEMTENMILDAVGPETLSFDETVQLIGKETGRPARLIHLPPQIVYRLTTVMGLVMKDVILTWEEVKGLMADLLASDNAPTGTTLFSRWLKENAETLGKRYACELARHFKKEA